MTNLEEIYGSVQDLLHNILKLMTMHKIFWGNHFLGQLFAHQIRNRLSAVNANTSFLLQPHSDSGDKA